MQKLYSTVYKSVVRGVQDLIKEIRATTADHDLQYWSWENRSDEDKLPRETLMGVNGFGFDENRGLWMIRFGLTLSTVDDANLLGEADIIDIAHEFFGEGKKVLLRNPETGVVMNELVSVAFEVMPMGQTQLRNYRTIGVELRRTGTDG